MPGLAMAVLPLSPLAGYEHRFGVKDVKYL